MAQDELKTVWREHAVRLDRTRAIDARLLRAVAAGELRATLGAYAGWRGGEVLAGVAGVLAMAPVVAAHAAEPRYLAIGVPAVAFVAAMTLAAAQLLRCSRALDAAGPVAAMQHRLAALRVAAWRTAKRALLGGMVLWLPIALLLVEAVTGVPALGSVPGGWLFANLGPGLAVLALGQLLARRTLERAGLGPRARRFVDAVSGRGLQRATSRLGEVAELLREDRGDPA